MLLPLFLHLAVSCAPRVAPGTLAAIASVESRFDGLAIHDNATSRSYRPRDEAEAIRIAAPLLAAGHSVDLGLMQVNSRNLQTLGITIPQAFDPCTNISAGAAILSADYADAARLRGPGQAALQAALSAYNTGDFHRGFENGYVAKFYGRSAPVPVAVAIRMQQPDTPDPLTAPTSIYSRFNINVRIH